MSLGSRTKTSSGIRMSSGIFNKSQQYAAYGRRTPFPWLLRRHSKVAAVLSVRHIMSWIVLILVSIFTALVNFVFLSSGTETSQKPMIIFNCAMLIGYVLMYMFYGSKRQSTLKTWLPIKSKIKAVLLRILVLGLCLAALPLAYKLSQASECTEFLVYGKGASLSWALSLMCKLTGPTIPALLVLSLMAWAFPSLVKIIWQRTIQGKARR